MTLYAHEIMPPKPENEPRQPSHRELAVRVAIQTLAREGLRINGLRCHPMTVAEMACDGLALEILLDEKNPVHRRMTYCGITIEQDANEPPPIS